MLFTLPTSVLCCLLPFVVAQSSSPKRGLVYIGNNKHAASDAGIWHNNTDLTWYYNYSGNETLELEGSDLEFVPMYWGEPDETTFRDAITTRKRSGENITHVLGFNEPDMERKVGGSDLSPSDAAELWQDQIEPLKDLGIKVGAPVVSGSPIGYAWLKEWEKECDGKCNPDFMPIHWYGIFDAFASWVTNMSTTYPDMELWVTEFGYPGASLVETQVFFNQSINMLDSSSNVTRYCYFGSVRAGSSNIGGNAAMLNNDGDLTDVGSWYLGGSATGAEPEGSGALALSTNVALLSTGLLFAVLAFELLG